MAVAFNSSSSYRADFMAAEATASQRVKNTQVKQDNDFSRLLDNRSQSEKKPVGSVNSSGTVNENPTQTEQSSVATEFADSKQMVSYTDSKEVKAELDRVCEVPDKEAIVIDTSEEIPEDSLIEIPDDVMELAKAIVSGEVDIKDVPAEKITIELLMAIAVVKKLEIPEEDEEEQEVPLETGMQLAAQESASFIDQIMLLIDGILSADSEDDQKVLVEAIRSEFPQVAEVLANAEKMPVSADKVSFEIPAELIEVTDNDVEIPAEVLTQAAYKAADDVAGEAVTAEVKTAETVKPQNNVHTTDSAKAETDTNGEVIVRKVNPSEERNEFAQQGNSEQGSAFGNRTTVTKEISEELEMLRNAKSGKVKTEAFEVVESTETTESTETLNARTNSDNTAAVRTANPLMADSPIMLAGKDGVMVEVRPSEIVAQVTNLVEQAVTASDEATEYSMVLNPEEMGKITVKLIKAADGSVSVTIVAENASTQRLLEQNGELMQSSLRSNGVQLQSWQTVNEAHQETMQREYEGSSKNPYYREENENNGDEQPDDVSFADIIAAM